MPTELTTEGLRDILIADIERGQEPDLMWFPSLRDRLGELIDAARAEARQGTLDAAWERAEKALPEGMFLGVSRSSPEVCNAHAIGLYRPNLYEQASGSTPIEALDALSTALEAMKPEDGQ
jgi:hypothetical protein